MRACFSLRYAHIWTSLPARIIKSKLHLSNIALWFPDFQHWLLCPIADLLDGVKGIFQSQSLRTFMVCNHPNLLCINLSPGSMSARPCILFLATYCHTDNTHICRGMQDKDVTFLINKRQVKCILYCILSKSCPLSTFHNQPRPVFSTWCSNSLQVRF